MPLEGLERWAKLGARKSYERNWEARTTDLLCAERRDILPVPLGIENMSCALSVNYKLEDLFRASLSTDIDIPCHDASEIGTTLFRKSRNSIA
jgi:hypothetical protein